MITVNLTNEQFVAIGRLVENERAAKATARDAAQWPDRDHHAATARLMAQTSDVLAAAARAAVAAARQRKCDACGTTGQPHYFVNTGSETLCVYCA